MQRIAFVLHAGYSVMGLAGVTVFEMANLGRATPAYQLHFLSESGGRVTTSAGITIETESFGQRRFDTVIVGGATEPQPATPGLIRYLKNAARSSRRLAAICTGAHLLAEAGLLKGKRVTTHWAYARALQAAYPELKMEEDRIFIEDGNIWTSAGMSAGIDLALALVERDLGAETAQAVARKLVLYHRRAGGQSQFSALLDLAPQSDRIQRALSFARQNLKRDLGVSDLAAAAHLSPRQFSRAFQAETGQSPAKAIERLRVEAARLMLEQGRHPIEAIAAATGFGDPNRMRRAFLRAFGQPPLALRRVSRQAAA